MVDPYAVLELSHSASDEEIRHRYLELVRRYSPERAPDRFAAVRAAYEQLRDWQTRLEHRLFEGGQGETLDSLIEDWACRKSRRRFPLKTLLQVASRS